MTTWQYARQRAAAEESAKHSYDLAEFDFNREYIRIKARDAELQRIATSRPSASRLSSRARSSTQPTSRLQTTSHTSSRS
jgi:hypothetical protein